MDADDVVKYCSGCFVVYFEDGYGLRVSFDENGDSKGRYNIMNFRRNRATRRYEYVTVGRWADRLSMDVFDHGINRITWAGGINQSINQFISHLYTNTIIKTIKQD